ncbi:hypothetical protein NP493_1016g02110 [Ridgeia piscesae]|uniref:Uncharacterized protein n=1 Tax=Ridgeia piscesae TaxID=27915 RepID=A0AAD9KIG5_RIDPI|nr:hypothetical protein NP493_1016g02110 [Ridgeia piscesae]
MEAILRALEQAMRQKNPDCIQHGMQLLAIILERHTGGVRLFSCASVVRQCLALVNGGILHHNFQLSDHAITALIHMLRREHLSSPVPYEALLTPIHSLLQKVDRCPRMHCRPVAPSQSKGRKGSEAGVTSWRSEQKIRAALIVVNKACNLAVLCGADPYANEETFSAPSQQQQQQLGDDEVTTTTTGSLQQFIFSLLRLIDESCVPVFMANYEYLQETEVYSSFLSLLSHIFGLWPAAADSLTRKLMCAGIIRLALEVSTKYGEEVKSCAISFLRHLLRHFMDKEDSCVSDNLRQDLDTGVSELIESYSCDVMHVLQLSVLESPDTSLRHVHYAALTLLHLAYTHEDRLAPEENVCEAIQTYISLHSPLDRLPHPVFKCLLLLSGQSPSLMECICVSAVTRSVVERVEQCEKTAQWCSRDPDLLHWCFSGQLTADSFGAPLVQFWMSLEDGEKVHEDESSQPSQILVAVAQNSTICVKTFMTMLVDGPQDCIVKVASCLRQLLRSNQEGRTLDSVALMKHFLPDILQRCLLNFNRSSDALSIRMLMDLYVEVKCQTPSDPLTPGDLSLTYHVCSMLSVMQTEQQQQEMAQQNSLKQSSFQFLNSLLVQSVYHCDNRVGNLLCSKASLLQLVESDTQEWAGGSGSQLLTLLLMQRVTPQVDQTVHIDVTKRLQLLLTSDPVLVTSTLMFWSAYLDTAHVTPALVTLYERRQRSPLMETEYVELGMDTSHVRLLFIYIQQHLIQDHDLVQQACLSCLDSLFRYIQEDEATCKHLTHQPWTEFILDVAFSQHQGAAQLPRWLWHFADILLRYQVSSLLSKHLAVLVNCFIECDEEAVDSSMVKLVTQVLNKNLVRLDGHRVNMAKSKLQVCASKRTTRSDNNRQALMMAAYPFISSG